MLLKVGIALMSAAMLMVAGTIVFVVVQRDAPVVALTEAAKKNNKEQTLRYGEPHRVLPESTEPAQDVKAAEAAPAPKSEPTPVPKPQSSPKPQPSPKPVVLQREGADWPVPTKTQLSKADEPRHYQLTTGAIMGLTIKAIGLYNVPVIDSDQSWALGQGVRHVPETSLPWSEGKQRNVYLEGHRLGYPGTGSYLIFYNLDKLKDGDEILLRDRDGKRYNYRVIDAFVVDPSESWVMGQVRGRDLVTLQTCTGPGYSQRLIVRAERV